ncbi:hypothetical protein OHA72_04715 [Dactylosporangium sp. NBC_01737]|uniref:hypothetical protein n=1 Tax=Dactylosporangium sp. NBC_01737 TaxID=2975959 RepID=UPI002E0DB654|nr:hypothetical protein OHA72_04715 [Dactylosporangium sp. NBC_01737]
MNGYDHVCVPRPARRPAKRARQQRPEIDMCDNETDGGLPCTVQCRLAGLLAGELAGAWDAAVAAGADPADLCAIVAERLSTVNDDRR